jgi:hypothetical protein
MKSHPGGVMLMGTGAAYSTSKKQKLNTKSSTEAKLVGINDVLPQVLWTKYFLEGQGYGNNSIIYEDNQSTTMKLANNGNALSRKGTRHINIHYFFITDCIARNDAAIQYCPTKDMVADYFTKPLQGELFYKFRDQIMGVVPMEIIYGNHRSVLDHDSNDPASSEKPEKLRSSMCAKTKQIKKGVACLVRQPQSHLSWADVMKSNPRKAARRTSWPPIKR